MGRAYPDIGDRQGSEPRQAVVVTALGITQIFAWGCSYYLPAVLAKPSNGCPYRDRTENSSWMRVRTLVRVSHK
jgi:hypothetical protein